MSSALKSPAPTLKQLRSQLVDLADALAPLVDAKGSLSTLTSILEKQVDVDEASSKPILKGRLQSAQLQSSLAYILVDLVWILHKVNGNDPQLHPVTAELKRVQQYLQKVYKVDQAGPSAANRGDDDKGKAREAAPAIDAAKAKRFIQGALGKRTIFAEDGSVQSVVDAGQAADATAATQEDEQSSTPVQEQSSPPEEADGEWTKANHKKAKRTRKEDGQSTPATSAPKKKSKK